MQVMETLRCKAEEIDPTFYRSPVWWINHALAYRALNEWADDYKEAKLLKALSGSGVTPIRRRR